MLLRIALQHGRARRTTSGGTDAGRRPHEPRRHRDYARSIDIVAPQTTTDVEYVIISDEDWSGHIA